MNLLRIARTEITTLAVVVLAILITITCFMAHQAGATAVVGFQAGNIISDGVMQNYTSMSASQIQTFFNQQVPSCDTNGTQPASDFGYPNMTHAQYAAMVGWPGPPYICLKDYSQNGLSAAQIIYNASQAYHINPQVLIVLLQKEQGLVNDTWPLPSAYTYATGYGCPDNAACDSQYYGFTNQVNWAATLYHNVETQNPNWYSPYTTGTNYIQWNPNSSCGGSSVNIVNWATAALYDYTPYQPNQAALSAGWGTGDSCSSYGNRNFYLYFLNWFGSPLGGPDYNWAVIDQAAYSDEARTKRLPYTPSAQPGTTLYMQIKAINLGTKGWDQMTRLVTTNPIGRGSTFYDPADWLTDNRPATPQEGTVSSGKTGTFNFTMIVPQGYRTYYEHFDLVEDGIQLFPDLGQNFTIDATPVVTEPRVGTTPFGIGSYLRAGQTILSPDGNSALTMQPDGNLVLRTGFQVTWQTNTAGNPGSSLVLQGDGNLVLYNSKMQPLWNSVTQGTTSNSLNLQSDANLALYGTSGPTWSTSTGTIQSQYNIVYPRIAPGGILYPGQRIETADRQRMLILQGDGNLVLYNSKMQPLWNSVTNGKSIRFLAMQTDGNLVLYDTNSKPVWASGTDGNGSSRLILQDDTNLVIYKDNGQATWATYTNQ